MDAQYCMKRSHGGVRDDEEDLEENRLEFVFKMVLNSMKAVEGG